MIIPCGTCGKDLNDSETQWIECRAHYVAELVNTQKLLTEANHRYTEAWRQVDDVRKQLKDANAHILSLRHQLLEASK